MNRISRNQLDELCRRGTGIDEKGGYPGVVIHPDGAITKIWARRKGLFSSSMLRPYSRRFVDNATELRRRGVTVPDILDHAALERSHVRIVTYRALPGTGIRELLKTAPAEVDIPDLCRFIHSLHENGILFRAMHLGNIIQLPGSGYGLIDFADVRFYGRALPLMRRAANLATPMRYQEDMDRIEEAGLPALLDSYLAVLRPSTEDRERFLAKVGSYLK